MDDKYRSLINPGVGVGSPCELLLSGEPEINFVVGGLNGVGSVADVSTDINAVVSSDGSWFGIEWLGGTEHFSSGKDGIITFPNHAADWSGGSVLNESVEEFLGGKISVVLLEFFLSWLGEFHGNELEPFGFKSRDDGTDESSLDTIWFDHDVCSLSWHFILLFIIRNHLSLFKPEIRTSD